MIFRSFRFYILSLICSVLSAQNNAPTVDNVSFTQRTDGSHIVDIYYDLNDSDGDTMTVTIQASNNAGTTWDFTCEQIRGDVGENITSGTGKHIVWDFGAEHPATYNDQIRIKIIADDNQLVWGTVTDIDGNVYKTVKIGNQWWMAENLKVTHYRNGEAIPNAIENTEWSFISTGARCSYNNDNDNVATYGLLYNWYAVDDNRNIAPAGWHVPSNEEWKQLEMNLGMSQSDADDNISWIRGKDEGGKMKSIGTIEGKDGLWFSPNNGATNESGFSALPSGYRRDFDSAFYSIGFFGYWWSATDSSSEFAWYRALSYDKSGIIYSDISKGFGLSIRCVKD